jgi:acetyl coenzyme A synthetase (ADP forming)-like protein
MPQVMPYPAHRESDVVLKDGSTVHVRPVRHADAAGLLEFLQRLSENSRALRFFAVVKDAFLEIEARRETDVDYSDTFGIVATAGHDERIVAHAMYARGGHDRAETAYAVADDYQGRGLGTILLGQLAEVAAANGIRTLEAEVLPHNHPMIALLRQSGFPVEVQIAAGEIHATFPSLLTEDALEHFESRERVASTNALKAFFEPTSVAVIGASRERGTIGGEIVHNLLSASFSGAVYPVNPKAAVVQSVAAYASVADIPADVSLAVIAVPADHVLDAAEQCARKGVRALVVISAGFAETGPAGRERQVELLRICRESGMRLVGPNCMGLINTDPDVRLAATFAPHLPSPGRIGFSSQSGALGVAIIQQANARGLGLSTFLSVGNKADISGNDLMSYWESDPRTDVILLYLESFGNPLKFSRIARRVGRSKPIAVVKSGRTKAGARATSSHTGALLASSDVTVDALFRQSGVIRTDTLEELFDVATLLAHQPPPSGRGVAIVTNAGGPAILCADACEAEGLEIPVLGEAAQAALRAFLPPEASLGNPVDMIASATGEHYRSAIRIAAADPSVDAIVAIFIPPLASRMAEVASAIVDAGRELAGRKPLLTVFMGAQGVPELLRSADLRIPSYAFPESAARALARAARYGAWKARPVTAPPAFAVQREAAAAIVAAALARRSGWLPPEEVHALLACYGLPLVAERLVGDAAQAGKAADALGGRVALKAVVPGVVHKSDAGLVQLGLQGAVEVRQSAAAMARRIAAEGKEPAGFLVQQMAPQGVEMIVGVVHDPHFGPVVACGAGGVMVEILGDVAVGLSPLTEADASDMLRRLKTYPLLTGFRGRPPVKVAALEDAILRVGALVADVPEIAEMDLNPIVVHEAGASIVDARVRVEPAVPPLPLAAKR